MLGSPELIQTGIIKVLKSKLPYIKELVLIYYNRESLHVSMKQGLLLPMLLLNDSDHWAAARLVYNWLGGPPRECGTGGRVSLAGEELELILDIVVTWKIFINNRNNYYLHNFIICKFGGGTGTASSYSSIS